MAELNQWGQIKKKKKDVFGKRNKRWFGTEQPAVLIPQGAKIFKFKEHGANRKDAGVAGYGSDHHGLTLSAAPGRSVQAEGSPETQASLTGRLGS